MNLIILDDYALIKQIFAKKALKIDTQILLMKDYLKLGSKDQIMATRMTKRQIRRRRKLYKNRSIFMK